MIHTDSAKAAIREWGANFKHIERAEEMARAVGTSTVTRHLVEAALAEAGVLHEYRLTVFRLVGNEDIGYEVEEEVDLSIPVYGSHPPDWKLCARATGVALTVNGAQQGPPGHMRPVHHYGEQVVEQGTDIYLWRGERDMPLCALKLVR